MASLRSVSPARSWESVSRRQMWPLLYASARFAGFLTVVLSVLWWHFEAMWLLWSGLGVLVLFLAYGVQVPLGVRRGRISVGEHEVLVRTGWFTRTTRAMPIDRIQSVTVASSWLQRLLGLADVRFFGAGELDVVACKGLPAGVAHAAQWSVMQRALAEEVGL